VAFDLKAAVQIVFGVQGAPSVKQATDDVKKLGDAAEDMGTKANRGAAGLDRVAEQSDVASRGLSVLRGVLYGVAAAFGAGAAASVALARRGIEYNEFLETARLGIASLIAAQTDLSDASGKPLKGMEALTAATVLAEDQMTKLRIAGLETSATTQQLAEAFQQAVGAGLSAGLNLDQIRQLTVGITQAAGALGVPMNQISQEVRTILDGTIDMNARVAKSLGISNEMVKSWREQGKLAEELKTRLVAFQVAGGEVAKTWTAVKSNMGEALDTFSGEVTSGMFERLKASGQKALSGIFDLKESNFISREFQGLANLLTDVFDRIGAGLGGAMEWVVEQARELSQWLSENKDIAADLVESTFGIGRQLLEVVSAAGSIVKFVAQWALESGTVQMVLRAIALLIAGLQDGVKLLGAAFAAVGGAILEVLFKPLESWLRLMGNAANFVKAGWGDSFLQTANEGRDIYQRAYASAAKVVGEFQEGQTAVGRLRREWEQFDGALAKTAAKRTSGSAPNYKGRPGAPGEPSKADQGIADAIARLGADAAAQDFEERFGKSPAVQRYFKAISEIQPGGRFAGASDRLKQQFAGAATTKYQGEAGDEQTKRELDAWQKQQEEMRRNHEELSRAQSQLDQDRVRDWVALQDDMRSRTREANLDLIQDDRRRAEAQLAITAEEYRQRIELLRPNIAERQSLEAEYNEWLVAEQAALAERLKPEWRKMVDAWSDTTQQMRDAFDDFVLKGLKAGEDAFVEFAKTGKISTRSLVDMIIAEQARLFYRQNMAPAMSQGLQSVGNWLFGGGAGTPGSSSFVGPLQPGTSSGGGWGSMLSSVGSWIVSLFHEGGMAYAPRMARAVDPSVFHGARRMHGGAGPRPPMLRSGEVPAILDSRESVFTPEQLRAMAPAASGPSQVINYHQTVNVLPGANKETANQAALRVGTQTQDILRRLGAPA